MTLRPVFCPFLIACACAASGHTAHAPDPLPEIPAPSGHFGIGRAGYDWVDGSRPDPYSTDAKAHRELMVWFWYPTAKNSSTARGPYLPGARRMDTLPDVQNRMSGDFGRNWKPIVSGAIFSHAVEHAPVLTSAGPLPVIIFSHGLGSTGFSYTCLIEDLVSHGYVVASIEHTGIPAAVWFPDGRVAPRHMADPPPGLSPQEAFRWMVARAMEQISEGAADVRFALDRMTEMNGRPKDFPLARKIDLNRIAAMGHSAGAEFAARACQLDPRIKTCVDLDGGMVPWAALPEYPDGATLKQPLLFLEAFHPESRMGGT